jgi:glycosidase
MKKIIIFLLLINTLGMHSQKIEKVEPPNWWVGMKNPKLQLLIYGKDIAKRSVEISDKQVVLESVEKAENSNYVFLNLDLKNIVDTKKFDIRFKGKSKDLLYSYELRERPKNASQRKGFDASDVIYLITPDRFSNGNPDNDIDLHLKEKTIDRNHNYARHGGDIQGITNHLDYIHEMGFTAIWPTPMLENNMPSSSYHGYAMTDFYKVDPRFGTLAEYQLLAKKVNEKGMKLIMDQVANHCGSEHWWMKDLPFNDWVNFQSEFENNEEILNSNHRRTSNQDIYASKKDQELMSNGWFVSAMPDLNQKNTFLAKYIIQNNIWWIETLNVGGIRQDTYPYSDKEFMSNWAGAIMNEYPNFSIVGEEWSLNPLLVGYWQHGAQNRDGYESNLSSTMDFPMQRAIVNALNEEESWDKGLVKIYEGLANDFSYAKPDDIMIFMDNHDMDRVFTQLKKDVVNTKMALSYILTLPRIPQIYYGTEILLENSAKPGDHGLIRSDFPGGWTEDTMNAFTGEGLTIDQLEMQSFLRDILKYRKNSKAIHSGKTIHFAPDNGTYTIFRLVDNEIVMLILNKNEQPITIDVNRFEEIGLKGKTFKNLLTGEEFIFSDTINLTEKGPILLTSKM